MLNQAESLGFAWFLLSVDKAASTLRMLVLKKKISTVCGKLCGFVEKFSAIIILEIATFVKQKNENRLFCNKVKISQLCH